MKQGRDIAVIFPGLYLVHQNLPEKKVDFHSHAEHLIFIPLRGEIRVLTPERTLKAGPGKMVYLPAGLPHAFDSSQVLGERLIAMVSPKLWKRVCQKEHAASEVAANQLTKEILFYLLLHAQSPSAKALIEVFVQTLDEVLSEACHLIELDHLEGRIEDDRIRKTIAYFREHLSESISMEKVAKSSGLSVRNFNRLFAQEVGMTPKQILTQCRMARRSN